MAHVTMPRLITPAQVAATLTYQELIPAVERALGTFSKRNDVKEGDGEVGVFPQRTLMKIRENNGHIFTMPVFSAADDVIATKIVAVYPDNVEKGLSSHQATIILNDSKTGVIKAVMDGEHITAMRTAAASAVATKYLAREGSSVLAILGAGVQAESHVDAIRHVMTTSEIRVWTRSFDKAKAFAKKYGITACQTAQEAVVGADVITTCTLSRTPIIEASWLKPGAHINCVGACVPEKQELGTEVMKMAMVYTDNTPGAYKESGDIIHSKVEVFGEIGDVINGTKEAKKDEITVFKSQGIAIEDAVAAKLVYDKVMAE